MSSPTPKPAGNAQNTGLIFVLLILAIIGGEYYTLLHGQEVAEARAVQFAEPEIVALSPQEKLAARKAAFAEQQRQRILAAQQLNATRKVPGQPQRAGIPTHGTELAVTEQVDHAAAVAKAGQGVKSKLLVKAAKFYGPAGVYLRTLLLLSAIALVFVQKAPADVPGKPKRKPVDKKVLQIILGICAVVFLITGYMLLNIHTYTVCFIKLGYPIAAAAVLASGGLAGLLWASTKRPAFGLTTERKKVETPNSVYFPTADGGWITIANPFRGTLVLGGAGAGKTYSIGEPMVEQFAYLNFAGLIYDFKFPVLAGVAQKAVILADRRHKAEQEKAKGLLSMGKSKLTKEQEKRLNEKPVQLHIINFRDLTRSERVNPLRAADMPVVAFAEEYSRAIINNLNPTSIKKMEFFDISAVSYLTSIIWFYKKHYPQYCTIPHVVATAMHDDFKHVLSMLDTDLECGDMARSIITAVKQKAEKQIAAVIATLQVILTRINSPEIVWVLTPDEYNKDESLREGFSLALNDPDAPKLLCIGNDPTLKSTFSPVVSCIITVAIKLMNQQDKHRSYIFLDEAATIYVPGLEELPNTGRSNLIATVYMTQDIAQMVDSYGRDKMNVMTASFGNSFFGKVNSLETAKYISELVGREDKEMTSTSTGSSQGGTGSRNSSTNQSTSYQERNLVRVQDIISLKQGEFIGQTVETNSPFFQGTINRTDATQERFPLQPMVTFAAEGADPAAALNKTVQENFLRVRQEVKDIITSHPNTLAGASQ
ncbi:TraM recognition domain-containing protein [Hymenobacter bucti]|uniref:TraM recognition domain-containing protein n=1 Tax=Hymenobacter bucti TaxID=1844114 RepID=A0ABW4R1E1_9BACT